MKKLTLLFFVFHFSFFTFHLAVAQVIHIPADYPSIQQGIDAAEAGDTVLISPGTYMENLFFDGKKITVASLFLTTQDAAYISQTIIDGNNSGPVVSFWNYENFTALLCGFTIINGNHINGEGGGIHCMDNTHPILQNITITNNTAKWGGGIYCGWDSHPTLENVTIANNAAELGGGILSHGHPVFSSTRRCNIYLNSAGSGNDLYSYTSIEVILDTFTVQYPNIIHAAPFANFTFDILYGRILQTDADLYVSPDGDNSNSGLTADDPLKTIHHALSLILAISSNPHTIYLLDGTYSPSANNELFPIIIPDYVCLSGVSETAVILDADSTAGVMQIYDNMNSRISGMTITGGSGSGITCSNSDPILENLVITDNSSGHSGGGINCEDSSPTLENVEITNNTAYYFGGGIYCSISNPVLKNVRISGNFSGSCGGGIYCYGNPVLENVTISYNSSSSGGGIYCDGSALVFDSVNRCNIYLNEANSGNDLYSGTFVTVTVDTFTVLNPKSYHASPLSNFTFDILHGKLAQAEADVYVSPGGDNSNSGLTEEEPLKTINWAFAILLADSLHPRTIHLLEGTYSPSTNQEQFPVIIPEYISLAGVDAPTVILDAEGSFTFIQIDSNSSSHISGMTITGGSGLDGGGILCSNSSPTLENLIITGNSVHGSWGFGGTGGGISFNNSCPILKNVVIKDNSATGSGVNDYWYKSKGGGISCIASSPVFENVILSDNKSDEGGGIACYASSPAMKNVTIFNNTASARGGGIFFNSSSLVVFDSIDRCNIYQNKAFDGNDIFSDTIMHVVADTFSVLNPYEYHAMPFCNFTFDILHGYHEQAAADLYVSPYGDDRNTGLSPDDPVKTIHSAYSFILADILHPQTIHLLEGTYSQSSNGEQFPVRVFNNVSLAGVSPTAVILDAEGLTRVLNIIDNPASHISGMNLTGGNVYGLDGGGIYCLNSDPVIENVIINNNTATTHYTGYAGNYGGYGGGLYIMDSNPVLVQTVITGNLADRLGGGIYCARSNLSLMQLTFSGNTNSGIIYSDSSQVTLVNSIMWNDSPNELVNNNPNGNENSLTISYSDIAGGLDSIHSDPGSVNWLEGNISEDPLFAGNGVHPFMLTTDSPCRNAGTPDTTGLFLPLTDLAGGPRVWEDRVDMGAYEWSNLGVPKEVNSQQSTVSSYPNPTRGIVDFRCSILDGRWVSLKIYDVQGREVAVVLDENLPAGEHTVRWDATALPAGIYYYRLSTNDYRLTTASGKLVKY